MSSNTTEHGEHFNESIVNEVILEDMKKNRIDHMKYLPGMETMEESDVMEQVITAMNAYDYDQYTEKDVRRALEHDNRTVEDLSLIHIFLIMTVQPGFGGQKYLPPSTCISTSSSSLSISSFSSTIFSVHSGRDVYKRQP